MILWFLDRFGLPGSYMRIWANNMARQGFNVNQVRLVSLHKVLNRQLLTKYGTRKAPTWIPSETHSITNMIDGLIGQHKPRAVVLAAPEALACLGLHAEFATLHNLRGSVYRRHGLPHLVMLPMSAWNSLVSQKEIGAANYGYENQEAFNVGHAGVQIDGKVESTPEGPEASGHAADRVGDPRSRANTAGARPGVKLAGWRGFDDNASARGGVSLRGNDSGQVAGTQRDREVHDDVRDSGDLPSGGGEPEGRGGRGPDDRDSQDHSGTSLNGHRNDSADSEPFDASDLPDAVGGRESRGPNESDSADETDEDAVEDDGELKDDETIDQFFYEPVLSPVGRFVITADMQKLKRIIDMGERANGPMEPLTLQWR